MHPALDAEPLLRGAALRVTRPRLAVLTAVHGHPHLDTESILGIVRADLGEVSRQAVYDIPKINFDAKTVLTNNTTVGAYRGAGRPEATS